jgi:hypothetical protein
MGSSCTTSVSYSVAHITAIGDKAEGNTSIRGEEEAAGVAGVVSTSPGDDTGVGLEGGEVPGAGKLRGAERAIFSMSGKVTIEVVNLRLDRWGP